MGSEVTGSEMLENGKLLPARSASVNAAFLDAVEQRLVADVELLGRALPVPVQTLKRLLDEGALRFARRLLPDIGKAGARGTHVVGYGGARTIVGLSGRGVRAVGLTRAEWGAS